MSKQELLKSLKGKITDIENRPKAKTMLAGLEKARPAESEPVNIPDHEHGIKKKMNWINLNLALCPGCNAPLIDDPKKPNLIKCTVCVFKIGSQKAEEIIKNNNGKKVF